MPRKTSPPAAATGRPASGAGPSAVAGSPTTADYIVIFGSRKGWGIKVEQRYGTRCQFGKQAKAFDALAWAEQNWPGNSRHPVAPQEARA